MMWTVEHIGMNEKVVYIDGKELKKGQDGVMTIGLGSVIVFRNPKAGNQVHGQDRDQEQEQEQEQSDKIVFRVNDVHIEEFSDRVERRSECNEYKTTQERKSVELHRLGNDSTSNGCGKIDCDVDVEHKSDIIATKRDESTLGCGDARRGQDVVNDLGDDDGLIVNEIEKGNRSDDCSDHIILRDDSQCEPVSKCGETPTGKQAHVEVKRGEVELNGDSALPEKTILISEGTPGQQLNPQLSNHISNAEHRPLATNNLEQIFYAEKESGEVGVTPLKPIIPMEPLCASEFAPCNENDPVVDLVSPGGKGEHPCVNSEAANLDKEIDLTGTPRKDAHCTPEEQLAHSSSSQGVIDLISPDGKSSSLLSASSIVPVIDLLSDESQHRNPNTKESSMSNTEANAQSTEEEKKATKIQHAVYFLQRGKHMAQRRIDILTKSLQAKYPQFPIHSKFDKMNPPQYIVLDGSLNVDNVCLELGFKDIHEMATILEGVHLVNPQWVIKHSKSGPESEDLKPTMDQCWSGTFVLQKKRKASENPEVEHASPLDNTWMKRLRQTHEFAPVVHIPASKSNNEMISRVYRGNYGTNGNRNGNGNVSAQNQNRNTDLSRMLDTISKLYKDCPLDSRDSWRSYSYQIASMRLRYLDFDVNEQNLPKLKSIKGFGDKMWGHIRECLRSDDGKCELIRSFEHDEDRLAVRNMMNIWGVGPAKVSTVE